MQLTNKLVIIQTYDYLYIGRNRHWSQTFDPILVAEQEETNMVFQQNGVYIFELCE